MVLKSHAQLFSVESELRTPGGRRESLTKRNCVLSFGNTIQWVQDVCVVVVQLRSPVKVKKYIHIR